MITQPMLVDLSQKTASLCTIVQGVRLFLKSMTNQDINFDCAALQPTLLVPQRISTTDHLMSFLLFLQQCCQLQLLMRRFIVKFSLLCEYFLKMISVLRVLVAKNLSFSFSVFISFLCQLLQISLRFLRLFFLASKSFLMMTLRIESIKLNYFLKVPFAEENILLSHIGLQI